MTTEQRVQTVPGLISPRTPSDDAFFTAPSDPETEARRMAELHSLDVLDTEPEPAFEDLVRLATRIAGVPTALVSLVDTERQWFKARTGLDVCQTGRDVAFCDHVVRNQAELEVPDARMDPRFAHNGLVTGPPYIVFYAGFPMWLEDNVIPGTLCVIGYEPMRLSEDQKVSLRALADLAATQLKLRRRNEHQATEIERRVAAEAELAASRREYQLLADHSLDVIARYRPDGTITYVSPSVETVLGFPVEEVLGQSANGFVHPSQQEDFMTARSGTEEGRTTTLRVQVRTKDRRWRWLELTVAPVPGAGGIEILSAARDVTERAAAEAALAASESRYRGVYADSPVGIMLADENGVIVEANPAMCRLLGRSEREVVGRRRTSFAPEGDELPPEAVRFQSEAKIGDTVEMERRFVRADGEVRWSQVNVASMTGPNGKLWSLAHVQDITARKAAELALADSEANLASISQVVRQMHTGEDPRQSIVDAVLDIAGADSATIIEFAREDDEFLTVTASAGEQVYTGSRIPLATPSATVRVWGSARPLFVSDAATSSMVNRSLLTEVEARSVLWQPVTREGQVMALLVGVWSDVVDLSDRSIQAVVLLAEEAAVALQHHALLQQYASLAVTDTLTGLPNRRSWNETIGQLLQLSRRSGEPLVLAIADVDHFKAYNDSRGHLEGDVLLREIGRCAQTHLREVDVVARWGGEEFAIALPGCNAADAMVVLNRVRVAIPRGQTVSFGLAEYYPGATMDSLMSAADEALYQAKRSGRNRIMAAPTPD